MKTRMVICLLLGFASSVLADIPCADAPSGEIVSAVEQPDQSVSI